MIRQVSQPDYAEMVARLLWSDVCAHPHAGTVVVRLAAGQRLDDDEVTRDRPGGGRPAEAHGGLVVFVQRSDGALRLNVHLHVLALDGVYVRNADGTHSFRALPLPTPEAVHRVAERMHERLERLWATHGVAGVAGSAHGEAPDSRTRPAGYVDDLVVRDPNPSSSTRSRNDRWSRT